MSFKQPCPACRKPVATGATKCPYCLTEYSVEQVTEMSHTKNIGMVGCGAIALTLLVAVFACSGDEEGGAPETEEAATVHAVSAAKEEKTLPFTLPELAARFDNLAKSVDKPWKLSGAEVKDSGSFTHMVTENIAVSGNVAKNGQLSNLFVLGTGDGTTLSGLDVFMAMSTVYCAALDKGDLKQCGPQVFELVKDFEDGDDPRSITSQGIETTYARSDVIGNLMTIGPKE